MSFFGKFTHEFSSLFHHAPAWNHMASLAISFAVPTLEGVVAIVDPALLPIICPIVDKVKIGLATAQVFVGDGTHPVTLKETLTNVKENLGTILDLSQIKNHAEGEKVTAVVNILIGELETVISMLPVPAPVNPIAPVIQAPPIVVEPVPVFGQPLK